MLSTARWSNERIASKLIVFFFNSKSETSSMVGRMRRRHYPVIKQIFVQFIKKPKRSTSSANSNWALCFSIVDFVCVQNWRVFVWAFRRPKRRSRKLLGVSRSAHRLRKNRRQFRVNHPINSIINSKCMPNMSKQQKRKRMLATHRRRWPKRCQNIDQKLALLTLPKSVKHENCSANCTLTKSIWRTCWNIQTWNGPTLAPNISQHWPMMLYDFWIHAKSSGASKGHAPHYRRRDSQWIELFVGMSSLNAIKFNSARRALCIIPVGHTKYYERDILFLIDLSLLPNISSNKA